MNQKLLDELSVITEEEKRILDGNESVDRSIYYREGALSRQNEVDASKLLEKGKLIDVRVNTRFIHFPRHTHNFVECVYMCQGSTTHIVDGATFVLKEGDILFMNQHACQEILPAGLHDIAVNFIIMPQFFDSVLKHIENASSGLRDFLISCLTDQNMGGNALYFDASGILPVQNLMENLVWTMLVPQKNSRALSQETMILLFLNLMDHMDHVHMPEKSWEQDLILKLLDYIDAEYKDGTLTEFASLNHIDIYTLGRLIRRNTGATFTDLIEKKRMEQAAYLLTVSRMAAADISVSVGYENTSHFYRLFRRTYGCSPRQYRLKADANAL